MPRSPLFSERERAAWGGFLRTYARVEAAVDADLRHQHGLRHGDFEVLLRLRFAPGRRLRLQQLAEGSLLTRSGISRLVDRMVEAGYVVREDALEDGRGAYAVLTDAGETFFNALMPQHIAVVRELFLARLDDRDLADLARIWAKLGDPSR